MDANDARSACLDPPAPCRLTCSRPHRQTFGTPRRCSPRRGACWSPTNGNWLGILRLSSALISPIGSAPPPPQPRHSNLRPTPTVGSAANGPPAGTFAHLIARHAAASHSAPMTGDPAGKGIAAACTSCPGTTTSPCGSTSPSSPSTTWLTHFVGCWHQQQCTPGPWLDHPAVILSQAIGGAQPEKPAPIFAALFAWNPLLLSVGSSSPAYYQVPLSCTPAGTDVPRNLSTRS